MIKLILTIVFFSLLSACSKENKNQHVPSDLVLIEFAAALEEEQDKFQTQPLGPNPPKPTE